MIDNNYFESIIFNEGGENVATRFSYRILKTQY